MTTMTSRQRMLTAVMGGQPDCVPASPDMSNMIPCRLTGKPFWDIYLYQDPPLFEAGIAAFKHFGHDGWLPAISVQLPEEIEAARRGPQWKQAIVKRTPERIYTRRHARIDGKEKWSADCTVYYIADSPTRGVPVEKVGMSPDPPESWEDVEPRNHYPGTQTLERTRQLLGDAGIVGLQVGLPGLPLKNPEAITNYMEDPGPFVENAERATERTIERLKKLIALRPDYILIGNSGFMISNPEPIFRQLALPALQKITAVCKAAGMPTIVHCCGPEKDYVRMAAEESDLDCINPLEMPPMGDCDLAELKRRYGRKIALMGNLHTTNTMLRGSRADVVEACKRAIDAAAEGGGFILSTGDQCGRDTPDENIRAMVETCRTYGKY